MSDTNTLHDPGEAAVAAATYPVEVESQMNGLDIKVLTSSGTPLVVTFVSKEKADARCKAEIASGRTASISETNRPGSRESAVSPIAQTSRKETAPDGASSPRKTK